jgi:la-related protein 1
MNKLPSPCYRKPGPKRNNTNGTLHFPVAMRPYHQQPPVAPNFRPRVPPPHIAVPAYAFPPGSGPYPNGENPKPVSPAAAGQGFTPPAHAIDAKHVQPPVQGDPNAYAIDYPNGRPNIQKQGDHVNELH